MPKGIARGLRNNNPLNIRRTGHDRWVGMDPDQSDPEFVRFTRPEYGIRAAALILQRYQDRHGCETIRQLIARWAPPSENDTAAYVAAVARAVGVGPDKPVDVQDYRTARVMIEAMIRQENGRHPYAASVIDEGLRLAGIVPARPRSVAEVLETDTARGTTAATLSTGAVGAIATVLPHVADLDWRLAAVVVVVVAVLAVGGVLLWRSRRD